MRFVTRNNCRIHKGSSNFYLSEPLRDDVLHVVKATNTCSRAQGQNVCRQCNKKSPVGESSRGLKDVKSVRLSASDHVTGKITLTD